MYFQIRELGEIETAQLCSYDTWQQFCWHIPHVFLSWPFIYGLSRRFCCFRTEEEKRWKLVHTFTVVPNVRLSACCKKMFAEMCHNTYFFSISQKMWILYLRNLSLSKEINGQLRPTNYCTSLLYPNVLLFQNMTVALQHTISHLWRLVKFSALTVCLLLILIWCLQKLLEPVT